MAIEYLRRKTESYIYAATPELTKHEDLHPCDKDGNLLDMVSAPEAAGFIARRSEPQGVSEGVIKNIMKALDVPEDVARNITMGNINEIKKEMEPEQAAGEEGAEKTLDEMKATEMLAYAREKFGEKADHLYLSMGAVKLKAEIKLLEGE